MRSLTLVTGVAGFIGFHVARRLINRGDHIIGLDNVNDYYDVRLKEARSFSRNILLGASCIWLLRPAFDIR